MCIIPVHLHWARRDDGAVLNLYRDSLDQVEPADRLGFEEAACAVTILEKSE